VIGIQRHVAEGGVIMDGEKLALHGGSKVIEDESELRHSWRSRGMVEGLKEYTGAPYAFCVSSGTAGLISGLRAADCGPGDEVLCVAFTWIASVNCVIRVGATPVFVDIDPHTYAMDV
jgi:dTDP-4-amino-4,6-dideoxygalactose transaminase